MAPRAPFLRYDRGRSEPLRLDPMREVAMTHSTSALVIGFVLAGAVAAAPAMGMEGHALLAPSDVKWGPAPPALPPGAEAAVLSGNPEKAEPFVIRLKAPKGYHVPPHSHSQMETVTILSGTLAMGDGDTADRAKARALPAGGLAVLPAGATHWVYADEDTILQVNGMGPFDIKYVNPKDDPQRKSQ
jgi:quercetin dioxygenase-like cupin family protein